MDQARRVCSKCGERYAPSVLFCPRDGAPLGAEKARLTDDPYLGLLVAGQLELRELIGIGATGRVYRAHQRGIERDVALKVLHRALLRKPTVIARFRREARVASRLTHPNVVEVLMTGELEQASDEVGGEGYLAMEYLDGVSLESALGAAGGALPLLRALHVMLQVCDAVGEAHAQGVVHRDLKPENVMLVRRGGDDDFVKVLDFGVARMTEPDGSLATQTGVIFGTPRYVSPEGARGEAVGPAGDVYSLATMLYRCLAGETPFDANNPVGILIQHVSAPPRPLRSVARAGYVPEPIARVVDANLAKDPAERCPDARELGRALLAALSESGLSPEDALGQSTLLGPRGAPSLASLERTQRHERSGEAERAPPPSAPEPAPPAPLTSAEPTRSERTRRTLLIAACLVAGALVVAVVAARLAGFERRAAPAAATAPPASAEPTPRPARRTDPLPTPTAPVTAGAPAAPSSEPLPSLPGTRAPAAGGGGGRWL
ncbi:MAG: serine/threonine-protein kinase [Sorangiineae bacterium]|nr:serine/threonine-protein kinase [Polyangiaceae bacterium]MEB2323298.1 serine/threonine-protein kinase [Sorangiineae bacterium]